MNQILRAFSAHFTFVFVALLLVGCEQEITVVVPNQEPQIVVEGSIELGGPPVVLLSQSQDYFAPLDAASLGSLYSGWSRGDPDSRRGACGHG